MKQKLFDSLILFNLTEKEKEFLFALLKFYDLKLFSWKERKKYSPKKNEMVYVEQPEEFESFSQVFFDPLLIGRIPKETIDDFRLQYIKYYNLEKFHLKDLPVFSLYSLEERRSALICTRNDIFNEQLRAILKENAFQSKVAKLQDEILIHLENESPDLLIINFDDFLPLENLIQVFKNRPFYKNSYIRLGIKDFKTDSIFQKLKDLQEICNLFFSVEELKEKFIHSIGSQLLSSIFVSNVNCQKDIFLWKKNLNNKYVDIDIDRFDFSLFEEMERKEYMIKVKRIFEWLL